jgi:hypothetical protein
LLAAESFEKKKERLEESSFTDLSQFDPLAYDSVVVVHVIQAYYIHVVLGTTTTLDILNGTFISF